MRLPVILNLIGALAIIAAIGCGLGAWVAHTAAPRPYPGAASIGDYADTLTFLAIGSGLSAPIWFAIARVIGLLERIAGEGPRRNLGPALD